MKYRQGYEAVITIQHARLHASDVRSAPSSSVSINPYVHIGIMVPKGSQDVTVPTNCATRIERNTNHPVWNQTFRLPVMPNSDVLVLQVLDRRSSNFVRWGAAANPNASQRPILSKYFDSSDADDQSFTSSMRTTATREEQGIPSGALVGFCLLPVARIDPKGEISTHAMEIFPTPNEACVGQLFIAIKMEREPFPILTKEDIMKPNVLGKLRTTRQIATESRFLGIGELAAFLYEEGYSTSPAENWDRAVTMLAQQLAFRMFQIMSSDKDNTERYLESLDDTKNFERAKERILKEGGLWDGL